MEWRFPGFSKPVIGLTLFFIWVLIFIFFLGWGVGGRCESMTNLIITITVTIYGSVFNWNLLHHAHKHDCIYICTNKIILVEIKLVKDLDWSASQSSYHLDKKEEKLACTCNSFTKRPINIFSNSHDFSFLVVDSFVYQRECSGLSHIFLIRATWLQSSASFHFFRRTSRWLDCPGHLKDYINLVYKVLYKEMGKISKF